MPVIAVLTEGRIICPGVIVRPDPRSASAAEKSFIFQTGGAEEFPAKLPTLGYAR